MPFVVKLFPVSKCSCPSTHSCCHIGAVRKLLGLLETKRKVINITQLRKNAKKRDKSSGRKKPRAQDIIIKSANDHNIAYSKPVEKSDNIETGRLLEKDKSNGNDESVKGLEMHVEDTQCNTNSLLFDQKNVQAEDF